MEPVPTWYLLVVTVGPLCAQTHGWVLWGGITEAGAVLTPPAVSRAGIKIWHPRRSGRDTSWAWSQRKCLSPPLSTPPLSLSFATGTFLPIPSATFPYLVLSQPHFAEDFFCLSFIMLTLGILPLPLRSQFPFHPPALLPLFSPSPLPLANPFQWHNTDFLPTFLPSLNISLCGTVALDSGDDFIRLSWLGWWSNEAENESPWKSQVVSFARCSSGGGKHSRLLLLHLNVCPLFFLLASEPQNTFYNVLSPWENCVF